MLNKSDKDRPGERNWGRGTPPSRSLGHELRGSGPALLVLETSPRVGMSASYKAPVWERNCPIIIQAVSGSSFLGQPPPPGKCRPWWGGGGGLSLYPDTVCAGWGGEHSQGAWRVTEQVPLGWFLRFGASQSSGVTQLWPMYLLPFQPVSVYDLVSLYQGYALGFRELKHMFTSTLCPPERKRKKRTWVLKPDRPEFKSWLYLYSTSLARAHHFTTESPFPLRDNSNPRLRWTAGLWSQTARVWVLVLWIDCVTLGKII